MITFSVSTIKHQVTYSDVINIGLPVWEGLVRLLENMLHKLCEASSPCEPFVMSAL